jgi:hypothetical protein
MRRNVDGAKVRSADQAAATTAALTTIASNSR